MNRQMRFGAVLQLPAVGVLLLWMIVPLGMTIYFSTLRYSLLDPDSAPRSSGP